MLRELRGTSRILKRTRFLAELALCILLFSVGRTAGAGAGISMLTIFEPRCEPGVTTVTAATLGSELQAAVWQRMGEREIWGIELLSQSAATSAALQNLGTRAPRWDGVYSPGWISILNSNEIITYAALGDISTTPALTAGGTSSFHVRYELWDFILNHRIAEFTATGTDLKTLSRTIAVELLAELQLYFATVIEVSQKKILLNVGPESITTGTRLTVFAHGHIGVHPANFLAHGHREEDDHLLGSKIYARYRDNPTTMPAHSHSKTRWRSLLQGYSDALKEGRPALVTVTSEHPASDAVKPGQAPTDMASVATTFTAIQTADGLTTISAEELRLLNLANFFSGKPTGTLQVESFVKPNPHYELYFAVCHLVDGYAIPTGFVRRKTD